MTAVPVALARRPDVRLSRAAAFVLLLAAGALLYVLFQGQQSLAFDGQNDLFSFFNSIRDWFTANRTTAPIFVYAIEPIRVAVKWLVEEYTAVLTALGWIGVTAIGGALGLVFVTWRTALLVVGAFLVIGLLGLWVAMVDTLGLILAAVMLSLLIGIPLGILAGRSDRFQRLVTPVLDFMQIMPTFAYLAPLALLFLIGPATAAVATMIYAMPPAIRITALGIRGVPKETVEAATSLGSTDLQLLRKVQLPMARTTVGLAVNQTIMMALSMVVIAALVAAGGLGQKIISPLETLDVGASFNAGFAIVLLAMVLDRLTASASQATDRRARGRSRITPSQRRTLVIGVAVATAVVVLAGVVLPVGRQFPTGWAFSFAEPVNSLTRWITLNLVGITDGVKNAISYGLLNPVQDTLTNAPWWLVVGLTTGTALLVSGRRAALMVAVSLLAIAGLQVWEHAMETVTQVLVAVAITIVIGIAVGVAAARSDRFSAFIRPVNDAAQTMPSFVYLIPAVALFEPSRFTAIVAAFIYAIPAVIRLVEDGIRAVPATVIEAATAAGASRFQMIFKVQLPVARRSLLVATNQGMVLVLAMVVIGGLVGGGGLGYDVVAGFSQGFKFGQGMAAALALVLLGVVLDRTTQGAAGGRKVAAGAAA